MAPSAARRVTLVVLLAVLAGAAAPGSAATAQPDDPDDDDRQGEERVAEGEARVAELTFRVVALSQREATLDGSEQRTRSPEQVTIVYASDVLFDFDRSDLNAEARTRLEALADELRELGPRRVTIEGHTDDQGTPEYNQGLSERRAMAAAVHLDVQLDGEFVFEDVGYGESRPVAPNRDPDGSDNPEGRALNRRVVISYPTG